MVNRYSLSQKQHPISPPIITWKRWTDGWLPEIVAVTFGILCFLGLIILLLQCNNKPVFDWHGITVNALVALLSTASRASLMVALAGAIGQVKWILFAKQPRRLYDFETIDVASRDAWGRLKLLWKSPLGLASLGAFGAVLALLFDPFNQNLVKTQVLVEYTPDASATVGLAERYSAGSRVTINLGMFSGRTCNDTQPQSAPVTFTADFDMQSAVLGGLSSRQSLNSTIQQMPSNCASGNCTWDTFESLGVCSRCNDVASLLKQSSSDGLQYPGLSGGGAAYTRQKGTTKFTLPNLVWLETQNNWNWTGDNTNLTGRTTLLSSYGTSRNTSTVSFQDIDALIWSMTILRVRPRDSSSVQPDHPYVPEAIECALYYCVNRYTSRVTNGILHETGVATTDNPRDPASWQLRVNDTDDNFTVGPTLTSEQINDLGGGDCVSFQPRTDLRLGTTFNISYNAVSTISSLINTTFAVGEQVEQDGNNSTSAHRRLNGFGLTFPQGQWRVNGPYTSVSQQTQWKPVGMQPIFESPDLSLTFQRLAWSMSNSIRANSDNATVTTGRSGNIRIYAMVNWPWISLSAVVLVITVVQLVMSMIATGMSGAPVWKSSSLATFSRGHYIPESIKASSLVSAMERIGKQGAEVDLFAGERHESHAKPVYTTSFGREKKQQYTTIRTVA